MGLDNQQVFLAVLYKMSRIYKILDGDISSLFVNNITTDTNANWIQLWGINNSVAQVALNISTLNPIAIRQAYLVVDLSVDATNTTLNFIGYGSIVVERGTYDITEFLRDLIDTIAPTKNTCALSQTLSNSFTCIVSVFALIDFEYAIGFPSEVIEPL